MRAGVIGFGVGEQHAMAYAEDARARLVAICDPDPAKREAARARFPEAEILADPGEILARKDIDAVSIASPDDSHYGQIVAAIDAGKHIFVEKPVCLDKDELTDIHRRLQDKPELVFSSNLILRRSPRFQEIRRRIHAGDIGEPYYIEADYNYGRIHKIVDGWRGRIPNYSVMLGGGVHVVDLVLWIVGKRVVEVVALGNNFCTRNTAFGLDDFTVSLLRFEDGQVAKVAANFGCVMPHFHRLMVYGTGGTVDNDFGAARLWKSRDPEVAPEMIEAPYPGVRKGALIGDFIGAILEGTQGSVSREEVFATMAVCFAIEAAKASGKACRVAEIFPI